MDTVKNSGWELEVKADLSCQHSTHQRKMTSHRAGGNVIKKYARKILIIKTKSFLTSLLSSVTVLILSVIKIVVIRLALNYSI